MIPKKKKSETCADYRPISILNVDNTIYKTSIIAKQYEQIMGDIIDEDQTGFIKGHQRHGGGAAMTPAPQQEGAGLDPHPGQGPSPP